MISTVKTLLTFKIVLIYVFVAVGLLSLKISHELLKLIRSGLLRSLKKSEFFKLVVCCGLSLGLSWCFFEADKYEYVYSLEERKLIVLKRCSGLNRPKSQWYIDTKPFSFEKTMDLRYTLKDQQTYNAMGPLMGFDNFLFEAEQDHFDQVDDRKYLEAYDNQDFKKQVEKRLKTGDIRRFYLVKSLKTVSDSLRPYEIRYYKNSFLSPLNRSLHPINVYTNEKKRFFTESNLKSLNKRCPVCVRSYTDYLCVPLSTCLLRFTYTRSVLHKPIKDLFEKEQSPIAKFKSTNMVLRFKHRILTYLRSQQILGFLANRVTENYRLNKEPLYDTRDYQATTVYGNAPVTYVVTDEKYDSSNHLKELQYNQRLIKQRFEALTEPRSLVFQVPKDNLVVPFFEYERAFVIDLDSEMLITKWSVYNNLLITYNHLKYMVAFTFCGCSFTWILILLTELFRKLKKQLINIFLHINTV